MSSEKRRAWRVPVLAGLGYGLCVYLSLPPVDAWPLTLASAGVLIWTACRCAARPARAALFFGVGTLPLWACEEAWLFTVTPVGTPLLALYLAFFSALTVYVLATMRRAWPRVPMSVLAPLGWLAVEVFRGEVMFTGYGWFLLAHPLIDAPFLAAPAAVLGTYFVSGLVAALAGGVVDIAARAGVRRKWGIVGVASVVLVWTGVATLGSLGKPLAEGTIRVGIVQTNVPQSNKLAWTSEQIARDFARFIELTRALGKAEPRPEVIIWPETMFPGVSLNDRAVAAFEAVFRANRQSDANPGESLNAAMNRIIRDVQREIGIPMLVGSNEAIGARMERNADGRARFAYDAKHNSVVLIHDGRIQDDRYDKVDLMPFGEVIPYVWRWSAVQRLVLAVGAGGMKFDLSPGAGIRTIELPGVNMPSSGPLRVATPICFEVTRAGLCARLVEGSGQGSVLLINLSNDGWFGGIGGPVPSDAGRAQHLLAARWRCVELGVPLVRAVNTGISSAVDARGRVLPVEVVAGMQRATRSDGALVASVDVPFAAKRLRAGNGFGWAVMLAGWTVVLLGWVKGRQRRITDSSRAMTTPG